MAFDLEPLDGNALAGATLRVCRNALCSEARIDEVPTTEPSQGAPIRLNGELTGDAQVTRLPSGYTVSARVRTHPGEFPYGLVDGDVYTVELRAGDSTLLGSRAWTATYAVSQPNGPDCEPTCMHATLAPR